MVFLTNALAVMVQTGLKLDPHAGVTVVFRSKRGDRLKILVWDGTGMVLICKVLEQGNFACPSGCGGMVRIGEDRTERLDPPRANSLPGCSLILVDPGALSGDCHGATEIRLSPIF